MGRYVIDGFGMVSPVTASSIGVTEIYEGLELVVFMYNNAEDYRVFLHDADDSETINRSAWMHSEDEARALIEHINASVEFILSAVKNRITMLKKIAEMNEMIKEWERQLAIGAGKHGATVEEVDAHEMLLDLECRGKYIKPKTTEISFSEARSEFEEAIVSLSGSTDAALDIITYHIESDKSYKNHIAKFIKGIMDDFDYNELK